MATIVNIPGDPRGRAIREALSQSGQSIMQALLRRAQMEMMAKASADQLDLSNRRLSLEEGRFAEERRQAAEEKIQQAREQEATGQLLAQMLAGPAPVTPPVSGMQGQVAAEGIEPPMPTEAPFSAQGLGELLRGVPADAATRALQLGTALHPKAFKQMSEEERLRLRADIQEELEKVLIEERTKGRIKETKAQGEEVRKTQEDRITAELGPIGDDGLRKAVSARLKLTQAQTKAADQIGKDKFAIFPAGTAPSLRDIDKAEIVDKRFEEIKAPDGAKVIPLRSLIDKATAEAAMERATAQLNAINSGDEAKQMLINLIRRVDDLNPVERAQLMLLSGAAKTPDQYMITNRVVGNLRGQQKAKRLREIADWRKVIESNDTVTVQRALSEAKQYIDGLEEKIRPSAVKAINEILIAAAPNEPTLWTLRGRVPFRAIPPEESGLSVEQIEKLGKGWGQKAAQRRSTERALNQGWLEVYPDFYGAP